MLFNRMKIIFFFVILGMVHSKNILRYSCNDLRDHQDRQDNNPNELIISGSPEDEICLRRLKLKTKDQRNVKVMTIIGSRIIDPFNSITKLYLRNSSSEAFDWKWVINNAHLALINLEDNPIRQFTNDARISAKHRNLCNTQLESFPEPDKHFMKLVETLNLTGEDVTDTGDSLTLRCTYNQEQNGKFGTQLQSLAIFPMYLLSVLIASKPSLSKVLLLMTSILFQCSSAAPLSVPDSMVTEADLHFESKSLRSLNDINFNSYPGITHLYLTNNSLTHLNINSDSLTFLKLDNNQLKQIRQEEFKDVPHLKELFLAGNHLKEVVIDLDLVLPKLRRLDLSRNKNLSRVIIKSQTLQELILVDNTIDHLELKTPKLNLLVMRNSYYIGGELQDICKRHSEYTFSITYNREEDAVTRFYECVAKNVGKASDKDKHNELSISLLFLCTGAGIMNVLIIYLVVSACVRKAADVDTSSTEYLYDEGNRHSRTEVFESETVQALSASVWPPNVLGKWL